LVHAYGEKSRFIRRVLDHYTSRVDDGFGLGMSYEVLLLRSSSGVDILIGLGWTPSHHLMASRATLFQFAPGVELRTCSAEDLIILNLIASRPLDLLDAEAIAVRNHQSLDWRYLEDQAAYFIGHPEIGEELTRIRRLPETL
jgi:hypothetical protein